MSEIPSGIYQAPLYLVSIATNGNVTFQDIRVQLDRISYSKHSNESNHAVESDHTLNADNSTKSQRVVYTTTAPTSSPPAGTFIVYFGSSVPANRYDRVLYLISV